MGDDRWRINVVPTKPVRWEGGRVVVPLWLLREGVHWADVDLVLPPAQAELLHAGLCYGLSLQDGRAEPGAAPG